MPRHPDPLNGAVGLRKLRAAREYRRIYKWGNRGSRRWTDGPKLPLNMQDQEFEHRSVRSQGLLCDIPYRPNLLAASIAPGPKGVRAFQNGGQGTVFAVMNGDPRLDTH